LIFRVFSVSVSLLFLSIRKQVWPSKSASHKRKILENQIKPIYEKSRTKIAILKGFCPKNLLLNPKKNTFGWNGTSKGKKAKKNGGS
jgi:hypothetical protein